MVKEDMTPAEIKELQDFVSKIIDENRELFDELAEFASNIWAL